MDTGKQQPLAYSLSLAGVWRFDLDPDNTGIDRAWFNRPLSDTIELPGTTDERRKGPANTECETKCLTRVHRYVGPAFYQKELDIPDEWSGKRLFFSIERTKPSTVWIGDQLIGSRDSLTMSHTYDLSDHLTPGKHRLTVRIDTADLPPVGDGHQVSEHTQTNWNGLLGKIELHVKDSCFIDNLQAYPDMGNKQVKLSLTFNAACSGELTVSATAENSKSPHQVEQTENVTTDDTGKVDVIVSLGDEMQCWDEFNPVLYCITVAFRNPDAYQVDWRSRSLIRPP